MPYVRLACFALVLLLGGCRLPGWEGPVSRSLADCRRLSQQGMAALDRGEQEKAETLLAQAVNACPSMPKPAAATPRPSGGRGAQKEAIAQLDAASRVTPDDAALWARMAEMQLAADQVASAGQTAERALDLDSKLPGAWAVQAGVRRAAGKPQEALADYLRRAGLYAERSGDAPRSGRALPPVEPAGAGPANPAKPGRNLFARRRARRLPLSHRPGLRRAGRYATASRVFPRH